MTNLLRARLPGRGTPAFAGDVWLLAGGVLALALAFAAPDLPLLAVFRGVTGAVVGIVLIAAGAVAWHDPDRARGARRWLRAFRRTRPFWGGLLLVLGGWLVLRLSLVTAQLVIASGLTGFGGWLTGGGMILCGVGVWFAPSQRYVLGIAGLLLAVVSLIVSNLGGLFLGMLLGIVGASMVLAWGPKRPATPRGPRVFSIGRVGLTPNPDAAPAATPASSAPARPRPRPDPVRRPQPSPRT